MIKAIVVDDDMKSRVTLIQDLEMYCKEIDVIGNADSVVTASKMIKEKKPEIVFLDIELGDGTGFDVIELCKEMKFKVIFTTAYGSYGIKAVKFSAFDYLQKPILPDDLRESIDRYIETEKKADDIKSKNHLLSNVKGAKFSSIALSDFTETVMIELDDIIRCESNDNLTIFYLKNKEKITITKTLKIYEELLKEYNFVRIHNSHLINLKHLKKFLKNDSEVIMTDDSKVPVSTRKKEDLLNSMKKYSI
jgi:two-component system LytT family response regulator